MARTAPVPNIPPIPGMCPSIAVMAGGGGGGGGSGNSAGSGDGSASGDGSGSGDEATGDSRAAAGSDGCGAGGSSTCSTHEARVAAGDPIDVATGRVFTVPVVDLHLNGPLPLRIARVYSTSARRRNVGLGWGWLHSLAWELEERRDALIVHRPNGTRFAFPKLAAGEDKIGREGVLVRRTSAGYMVDQDDGLYRIFEPFATEPHRSRLARVHDSNANSLTLEYDHADRLVSVVDAVGRRVRFARNGNGDIESLEVHHATEQRWVCFARYQIDPAGDLVSVEDAEGARTRFAYDEHHRLTEQQRPSGLVFHYVYDDQHRCRETWGDYPDRTDPAFGPATSTTLADGSRARGLHHVKVDYQPGGFREVISVRSVDRYFSNRHGNMDKAVVGGAVTERTYDDNGHELVAQDAVGAVWKFERDARGRKLRIVDPLEHVTKIRRDAAGRTIEIVAPNGGVTRFDRDTNGNITTTTDAEGGVDAYRYDERGRMVEHTNADGERRSYRWDHLGNLIEARYPNGGVYRYEFDYFGRRTATINPRGDRFETAWSLRGEPVRKIDAMGGVTVYHYDGDRRLVRVDRPDGTAYEYLRGGIRALVGVKKPDGKETRIVYDIDERPLTIHDENGATSEYTWSSRGFVASKRRWDGHETRYKYDALGQTTQVRTSTGDLFEMEYDVAGQLVLKRFKDGTEHAFTHDAMGKLVSAKTAGCEVRFERNLLGGIVREVQTLDGDTVEVRSFYRPGGATASTATSLGHSLRYVYDPIGYTRSIELGDAQIDLVRDALGAELSARLPGGATIESEYDALGRLTRRAVPLSGPARVTAGEPDWVGRTQTAGAERRYTFSPVSNLLEVADDEPGGSRSYRYDQRDRLVSLTDDAAAVTSLGYDASTNAFPAGGASYRAGGVLERWEQWRIETDSEGRVVQKSHADGRTFAYEWAANGTLRSVTTPDRTTVRFRYDSFGRRVQKTVSTKSSAGKLVEVSRTRFVWDQDRLLQEVTSKGGRKTGRDYLLALDSFAPMAHAEVDSDGRRSWFFYLNDPAGTPEALVDGAGRTVDRLAATPWGRRERDSGSVRTPLRKQGEYFDDETGAVYNRYRYVDPESGRFLSPDPIGLSGGLNLYVPGPNAVGFIDPFGLTVESDRAAEIRENQNGSGFSNTTSVARLENGDTIVTDSNGSLNPSTRIRDPGMTNSRGTPGAAASGGVTQEEWIPHAPEDGTSDIENCHHAERRAIQAAEDRGTVIESISATNNCCPTCRQALRQHNPGVEIVNADGSPAPDP